MNNNKLWQTKGARLDPLIEQFTIADDYLIDQKLVPYDLKASLSHAQMLKQMGIITDQELKDATKGFAEILSKWEQGQFTITKEQEDGHTAIEQYLTKYYGAIGKKIHTARSRNDQSLVMLRLFMKDQLTIIKLETAKLIKKLNAKADENSKVPMPGYTHLQKAMPTTIGVWLDSFKAALEDFQVLLLATSKIIDQNPLGSASGFGVSNLTLDRELTTKNLDFAKTQENPQYCGFSRGFFENIVLQTLSNIMIIASKLATDLLLFTTSEFAFFSLPTEFTTGSSIMPQKRNYDLLEIMRGNFKVFAGYQNQIENIISSITSGYQRDLQLTKKPFINGVELCLSTISVLSRIIPELKPNLKNLQNAMTEDLFLTNKVYDLVSQGISFRDAYLEIKENWLNKN
jgi:argininosuccinate lyase